MSYSELWDAKLYPPDLFNQDSAEAPISEQLLSLLNSYSVDNAWLFTQTSGSTVTPAIGSVDLNILGDSTEKWGADSGVSGFVGLDIGYDCSLSATDAAFAIDNSTSFTISMLVKFNGGQDNVGAANNFPMFFGNVGPATFGASLLNDQITVNILATTTGGYAASDVDAFVLGNTYLFTFVYDHTTGLSYIYVNGTADNPSQTAKVGDFSPAMTTTWQIGRRTSSQRFVDGIIAAVFYKEGALSAGQVAAIASLVGV